MKQRWVGNESGWIFLSDVNYFNEKTKKGREKERERKREKTDRHK